MKLSHMLLLLRCGCGLIAATLLMVRMAGQGDLSWLIIVSPIVFLGAMAAARDTIVVLQATWLFGRMLVTRHDAQARKGTTYRRHRRK